MKWLCLATLFTLVQPTALLADADPQKPPTVQPVKAFDPLRQLVGNWEGTMKEGKNETKMAVHYSITSGGSVLVEKLMPGTPHEMTTLYYGEGDKIALTHFCMLGNHPKMLLKKSTKKTFEFEMQGSDGIQSPHEPHMHALKVTLVNRDKLQQEWTYFNNGIATETSRFIFKRKP